VKSLIIGQQLGSGVPFHLHYTPADVFAVFFPLLILSFHTVFARTPPKNRFFNLWAAANGVRQNSLAKSGIFSGISLARLSTALKNGPDERRLPRICLSLIWLDRDFRRCEY